MNKVPYVVFTLMRLCKFVLQKGNSVMYSFALKTTKNSNLNNDNKVYPSLKKGQ